MSKNPRPSSAYALIAAGFGFGALCMAGVYNNAVSRPAFAGPDVSVSGKMIASTSTENMETLKSLDSSFSNLAEFAAPAVVDIRATTGRRAGPNGERMPVQGGEGSGFIFRPDGYIITNDHVVGGFDDVQVSLKDGREFPGKVIRAPDSDIAVVKIEAKDLPTLAFADSSKARIGQVVMAAGAPFGLEQSFTFGHISAVGRLQGIQQKLYPDLIQTDAAINMGNSGGPLINIDGQVVGVNTAIFTPTGASAGIGFAIPSNQARFIAEMLINKGKLTRSMIGLVPENLKEFRKKELGVDSGAIVEEVSSDGPAAAAGIKIGDIIQKIGTTPIRSQLDLRNSMLIYAPGTTVPVELIRDGKRLTLNVKLEEFKMPQAEPRAPRGELRGIPPGFEGPDFEEFFKGFPKVPNVPPSNRNQPREGDVPPLREGRVRLGVSVGPLDAEARKKHSVPDEITGALVVTVEPGSVAEQAGLRAGDVISQLGTQAITSPEMVAKTIEGVKWGESLRLRFHRYGDGMQMTTERDVRFR